MAPVGRRNMHTGFSGGTYGGKGPLRRSRHKWEDNIHIYSIRKVLRPTISTQIFLGFPVPKIKC